MQSNNILCDADELCMRMRVGGAVVAILKCSDLRLERNKGTESLTGADFYLRSLDGYR
jgi:hypothetical protein